MRVRAKKHVRTKYRCRCGGSPKLAPGQLRVPGGGRYALDFAIEVTVSKHLDHMPLERQVRIMRREGLDIDSSTLWEQVERLARVLVPTAEAIRTYVVESPVVHGDETPWYMLKKGRQKQWLWSISRSDAAKAIALIGEMFLVERDLPTWSNITDERLRAQALAQIRGTRELKTRPLVEALACWAKAQQALPRSKLGEAITCLHNQWNGLRRVLEDPRVPLSNNAAERAIRGPVVGRKNFAGCKSVRGTEVAGVLYTLLESAKLSRVEPRGYLRAAAEAALTGSAPLLPHVHRERIRSS